MPRLLIQSASTGRFLAPDEDGQPTWVVSLTEAGGGVVDDEERCKQIIQDHCDFDDLPQIVDLDRIGTANDYA